MKFFEGLLAFAEHLEGLEAKLGGGRTSPGHDDESLKSDILKTGARMIEGEIKSALSGQNRFGLAPLSPETIAKKGNSQFLRDTGELAASIKTDIGEDEAHVGTDEEKAVLLEHGTSRMPPRPVFLSAKLAIEPAVHAMARAKIAAALDRS